MEHRDLVLSPRLAQLATWAPQGTRLADVGTDHALLPAKLLLEGRCSFAIAADISQGPLQRARQTGARYGLLDRMAFRLSDGLDQIAPDEVDTVVIAGMGGETIGGILARAFWVNDPAYTLLLQPMSKAQLLRTFLARAGFAIEQERLVEEAPFLYHVFQVRGGHPPQNHLPPLLRYGSRALWASGDPLLGQYCDKLLQKLDRVLSGLACARQPEAAQRKRQLLEEYAALLEKRKEI